MTRKRFVKLLMARGHSRNEAVEIAQVVKKMGGAVSYSAFHDDRKMLYNFPSIRALSRAMERFCDAMASATVTFQEFAEAAKN